MNRVSRWVGLVLIVIAGVALPAASQSLPAGAKVEVRLDQKLDTGEAKAGETFAGTLAQPVVVNGRTVMSRGTKVSGRVVEAVSSGRLKKPASITLELTSPRSQPFRIDGKSHLVRNAELIGGGAGAGALLGALAGGKKGAEIGAAVGAGAGTATAYMTGKKEIVLPAEMVLTFAASGGGAGARITTAASAAGGASSAGGGERRGSSGDEQGENADRDRGGRRGTAQALIFSGRDQDIIQRYFANQYANLPPGLAKRGGNLPPGLERQVERNGKLPPGLQKRVQPFPSDLSQQLPPLPAGYSRVVLGKKALILDAANKILDIMNIH